jgi:hypothetical protein
MAVKHFFEIFFCQAQTFFSFSLALALQGVIVDA